MEHFIKQFTIIDFLSMAVPGSCLILAWNYYVGGVTAPVIQFFGENTVILVVYFIMLSYLSGMLLQELSKHLEKNWVKDLDTLHAEWQSAPKIKEYYQNHFGRSIEEARVNGGSQRVGREIFLCVSDPGLAGSKLNLFQAFYGMGRNSTVAAFLIFVIAGISVCHQSAISASDLLTPVLCPVLAGIMYVRSRRFYRITQERAYRDFLILGEERASKKTPAAP